LGFSDGKPKKYIPRRPYFLVIFKEDKEYSFRKKIEIIMGK
jgi:hypothetical protein